MNLSNINAIVRTASGQFITYHSVHGIPKFIRFLDTKFPGWLWFTAYDKRTNEKQVFKNSEPQTRYWASIV